MYVLFIYEDYEGPQKIGVYDTIEQLNAAVCTYANIDSFEWDDNHLFHIPRGADFEYHKVMVGVIQDV